VAVQSELGITTASTQGEQIQIHDVRAYSMPQSFLPATTLAAIPNTMTLQLFDIENVTSGNANSVGLFDDFGSPSGICHVHAIYPVNDRPTFNRGTTAVTIAIISSPIGNLDVVDFDITYIRTAATTN